MISVHDNLGKNAEKKIKEWLDRQEEGYDFNRIPDQLSGFYGSSNICDFTLFKYPEMYYIESKATYNARLDFSMISDNQFQGLLSKSKIDHVNGLIIVLFASYKRAFILDINQIQAIIDSGKKSINIDKIDKWDFRYGEIPTISNNRKKLLDYSGDIEEVWKLAKL